MPLDLMSSCLNMFFPPVANKAHVVVHWTSHNDFNWHFLSLWQAKGFELSYLEKVTEVKDTVHRQSLLHHTCNFVVENYPDTTDLYSEISSITRSAKVSLWCFFICIFDSFVLFVLPFRYNHVQHYLLILGFYSSCFFFFSTSCKSCHCN